jgi:hypothetical protein
MRVPSLSAFAALSYGSPFHPEQCELAVAAAERVLSSKPQEARAREILAEGLLCRGLEHDDPWALQAAIRGLEERLSDGPEDFFAQLYLAEALRRRFPLSDRVPAELDEAAALLAETDVGEAREELTTHVREALAAVASHRAQFLPLLERREAELERGTLSPSGAGDLLTLLAHTGPSGVERALAMLDGELMQQLDEALLTFYRAELLRGRDSPPAVAALYRSARSVLCAGGAPPAPQNECQRAGWRLRQLERVTKREGGRP